MVVEEGGDGRLEEIAEEGCDGRLNMNWMNGGSTLQTAMHQTNHGQLDYMDKMLRLQRSS